MNTSPRFNPDAHANVCLLLEGTFPYVRGGVSTWVKQIIEGMPELTFSIIFLGALDGDYSEPAYDIPDNVVHLELHYLLEQEESAESKQSFFSKVKKFRKDFTLNSQMHSVLADSEGTLDKEVTAKFTSLLCGDGAITEKELRHSKESWETVREKYLNAPEGLDFNHFFWTVLSMHGPLFTLGKIAENAPSADLYHSVSTGYSGFLGAMLQSRSGKPYLISEHGIYTKERELDLAQVDWIPEDLDPFRVGLSDDMSYLRAVWIRFFKSLGRMSYASADQVFTLYNGNRLRQIADGCPSSKLEIIPNGVNVRGLRSARRPDGDGVPQVVALIGRVVPIKDIKNFIRAMRIVKEKIPGVEGWLIGPQDEDPDYTHECKLLVESLDLVDTVKFLGFQKPSDIFPQLGLNVLTSVSEGQPLVTLEGYAAGVPAVTTDVGSCAELVYGVSEEDVAIGAAGAVVPIANPGLFADAVVELLGNEDKWLAARKAAIERVERFYDDQDMISRYEQIYRRHLDSETSLEKAS